jgi:hypothetical protein
MEIYLLFLNKYNFNILSHTSRSGRSLELAHNITYVQGYILHDNSVRLYIGNTYTGHIIH